MNENIEEIRFEIAKLDVKPGDIVVIRGLWFKTHEDLACFRDGLSKQFTDLRFMVLPEKAELSVLAPI